MLQKEYKRRNVEIFMIDVTMEEISNTALEWHEGKQSL